MTFDIILSITKPDIEELKFSIDSPHSTTYKTTKFSALHLCGWIFYQNKALDIHITRNGIRDTLSCNIERNDVANKFKSLTDVMCGFSYAITKMESFNLSVTINETEYVIASISITPTQKVLMGQNGYLFLDHDTNCSREQFLGQKKISPHGLQNWKEYFIESKSFMKDNNIEFIFCLAPAKENVLSLFYPFNKAPLTPVEQLLEINNEIIYPVSFLRELGEISYSKIDTHWSDFAALQVAEYLDKKISNLLFDTPKSSYPFYTEESYGDLGIKTSPKTAQKILKADFTEAYNKVIYNNEINNRGWVRIFDNHEFISNETIVFFGDSYSVNMLPYFISKYRRVVHVFSGASIDYEIIEHEKPTKVFVEIASRFITTPPKTNFCFTSEISRKMNVTTNISKEAESSSIFYVEKMKQLSTH